MTTALVILAWFQQFEQAMKATVMRFEIMPGAGGCPYFSTAASGRASPVTSIPMPHAGRARAIPPHFYLLLGLSPRPLHQRTQ